MKTFVKHGQKTQFLNWRGYTPPLWVPHAVRCARASAHATCGCCATACASRHLHMDHADELVPLPLNVQVHVLVNRGSMPRRLTRVARDPTSTGVSQRWIEAHASTRTEHASRALLAVARHVLRSTVDRFYGELVAALPWGGANGGMRTRRLRSGRVLRVAHCATTTRVHRRNP